ncbi:retrovirus-related pol polyprotein from transposon TNT 1-94 [Tanacetum coccineum]
MCILHLSEYYYADHMNAILGVYTDLDEVTNLKCDYLETLEKCKHLEKELSKSRTMSKSFKALQKHAINLELDLKQCKEKIKNDKSFKENQSNVFMKEREQYFEIQDLKAQLQDKGIAIRVIPNTSVSRPQLKSNQLEDKVMSNNSKGKKQEVEDHRRNFKFSKNKTSVTACNDSLNAKTSNVNFVCVTCGKCLLNDNHDLCVLHYINGVSFRTRKPIVVPISTREPKHKVNHSVATSSKKTVATDSNVKKSRNITRNLYEQVSKTCSWWYPKYTPHGYNWKPKSQIGNVNPNVSMPLGNASRTTNILEHKTPRCSTVSNTPLFSNSFAARTVKFGNDQIAPVLGYGDLGNDLLTGSHGTYLYSITLQDSTTPNPICLMAKATSSQAWLWHRRLSHLNFDTINLLSKNNIVNGLPKLKFVKHHLCSSCEMGKAKRKDGENLDKMKEKGDACIFVGYSSQSKAYKVFNKRTRIIVETIHVNFDELPQMASDHVKNVPQVAETVTTSNELELLYNPMFSELLNGTSPIVSKSFAIHVADNPKKHQHHNITHTSTTTDVADPPPLNIQSTHQTPTQVPTVTASENIIQAETNTDMHN